MGQEMQGRWHRQEPAGALRSRLLFGGATSLACLGSILHRWLARGASLMHWRAIRFSARAGERWEAGRGRRADAQHQASGLSSPSGAKACPLAGPRFPSRLPPGTPPSRRPAHLPRVLLPLLLPLARRLLGRRGAERAGGKGEVAGRRSRVQRCQQAGRLAAQRERQPAAQQRAVCCCRGRGGRAGPGRVGLGGAWLHCRARRRPCGL